MALLLPPRSSIRPLQASRLPRESPKRVRSIAGPPREEARIYLLGPIPAVPSISLVWFGVPRPPKGDAVRPPLSIPSGVAAHVAAFVDRLADWRSATTRRAMQSDRSCQGGRPLPPVKGIMQIRPAPSEDEWLSNLHVEYFRELALDGAAAGAVNRSVPVRHTP